VHTPDGSPCGLLNHLSHTCEIIVSKVNGGPIPGLVASLGVHLMVGEVPFIHKKKLDSKTKDLMSQIISVQLDGKVIGWCEAATGLKVAQVLRDWKVKGMYGVPLELEIGFVPPTVGGQYPGLFMFTSPCRMVRPVKYLITGTKDYVGPFEQVYMNIACLPEDIIPGVTTHQEFAPTDMLSIVASMTPFSDFNQSPRNMYQCQVNVG
jgi:DNA-directed RNA polymerase I subunit RPA2